jgi:hypothetical protein
MPLSELSLDITRFNSQLAHQILLHGHRLVCVHLEKCRREDLLDVMLEHRRQRRREYVGEVISHTGAEDQLLHFRRKRLRAILLVAAK